MNITFLTENEHYYIFNSDNGKISVGKYSEENPNGAISREDAANIALNCFNEVVE